MEREVGQEVDGQGEQVEGEVEVASRGVEGMPIPMTKRRLLGEEGTSHAEEAGRFSKTTWPRR